MNKSLSSFLNRKMLLCVYTGFSSGLPLFFIIQLLPAWLKVSDVNVKTIGFFTLTQLPYLFKFLWSPLLDKASPFRLGYRKGWILLTQLGLLFIMPLFGFLNPKFTDQMAIIMILSLITAFISATQDIAIDAYRRELLNDDELGNGNSIHINAYRIAGFVPGGLSLIMAHYVPWYAVYLFTAAFLIPLMIITLIIKEPEHHTGPSNAFFMPAITDFFNRSSISSALLILTFIACYKLGDSLATSLATPFYLDMQFNTQHIGTVAKNAVVWPSIIGAFIGGAVITKCGLNRALWIAGFVQMFSILGFVWLASEGPFNAIGYNQLLMLAIVISIESIGVGMGSAALVTYIAKNTSPLYTATQFALFTGFSAIPRTLLNSTSGILSSNLGWANFFWLCFILAVPGMLLLHKVAPWQTKK